MRRRFGPAGWALLCLLGLCAPLRAESPLLAVSINPLHLLAAEVAGPAARIEAVIPPQYSPHDYRLRPSERMLLGRADAVLWMGPRLETGLASLLQGGGLETPVHALAAEAQSQGDAHDWLDPRAAAAMARTIASVLSRLDPAGEEEYRRRAAALAAELGALERDLRALLEPLRGRRYWVAHDAYAQFERRFGLQHAAVVSVSPERSPGSAHILSLRRQLQEGGVDCVFREPQYHPSILERLLADFSVEVIELDPLATDRTPGEGAFVDFLRNFGEEFAACGREG